MSEHTVEGYKGCTCAHYVVDFSDPERYHPENVAREDDPACPVHHPSPAEEEEPCDPL